ncbi:MAG: hypothetical protein QF732_01900 [Nitrospinaceae bacterium]|jgi:hypothetical protein|nr:hypothetical protein [Nitrospinaceae bacterium]
MSAASFANIGMEIQPAQAAMFASLARLLRERHGSRIHLYVRGRVEEAAYRKNNTDGLWESVTNGSVHIRALQEEGLNEKEVITRAHRMEELVGEPINRLALPNRQMGHAFAAGAWRHPVAPYVARADNIQLLHALTESAAFWEREIREKNLGLVMDGSKFMAATARALGVPYRRLTVARFETYCYWAVNEYFDHPGLEETYDGLDDWPEAEIGGSYALAAQKYEIERHARSWWRIARALPESILRHFYYKARGMEKGDSVFLSDLITSPFRIRNAQTHLARIATMDLNDLAGKTLVYYPLQKEPEATIGQAAPECLSQHATILSLARDLPAGVLLVIKENTSAIGRRTASFYDQISALKNVVLLRSDTSSIDAIKQAAATVTIAGTASMEAAILGKPSLTFSDHIKWGFLPHARVVRSESELPSLLRWAVSGPFDADQARRDGARFLAALKESSMNLEGFGRDRKGGYMSDERDTETLYSSLCRSLGMTPMEASPAKEKEKAKVA